MAMPLVLAKADGDGLAPPASGDACSEESLWQRLREHTDAGTREALIERYRPFARVVAATYFGRRIDDDIEFDDYHQWALVAMIESVDRFDATRGIQFKTFASRRMHGAILDGIESATEKQRQIAMRRRLREERVTTALEAANGAKAKGDDSFDNIFRVLAEVAVGLALGMMLEDSGMIAPAPDATVPDQAYAQAEQRQLAMSLRRAVKSLTEQEQTVIRGHYIEEQLFSDIATQMGLTKGRVSQVHKQALEKLRRTLNPGDGLDVRL
jgi:RNA polymerase sigma factor for flagellar operon FliA